MNMTTTQTKLAKAVTLTLAGAALSTCAISTASAHVMYNAALATDQVSGTDGWVYGGQGNPSYPTVSPGFYNGDGSGVPVATTPLGYSGKAHLNWAAEIHNAGDVLEVSEADAAADNNNAIVEIDTGAGAWQDGGGSPLGVPTGWKHQTDIGLIKAHEDMWVTLTPSVVGGNFPNGAANFGITVFHGMDTNTGSYSHHGSWNCPTCATPKPFNAHNPFGTQGVWYYTHDATVDSSNPLTFFAVADHIYSIYIGGAGVGHWAQNVADYVLEISTAPVPVPAATWLFGGALASLIGVHRRRRVVPV